jgi:hypothetical protein
VPVTNNYGILSRHGLAPGGLCSVAMSVLPFRCGSSEDIALHGGERTCKYFLAMETGFIPAMEELPDDRRRLMSSLWRGLDA